MQPPAARGVFISATTVSRPTGHWLVLRLPARARDKSRLTKTTRPLAVPLTREAGDDAPLGCFRIYRNPRMDLVRSRWGLASRLSSYGSGSRTTHQLCSRVSPVGIRGAPWASGRGLEHGAPWYPIPSGRFARCEAGELRDVEPARARWQTSASRACGSHLSRICAWRLTTPPKRLKLRTRGTSFGHLSVPHASIVAVACDTQANGAQGLTNATPVCRYDRERGERALHTCLDCLRDRKQGEM